MCRLIRPDQDHCGQWIKREKQDSLFDTEELIRIEQSHESLHLIAQPLQLKYQDGEVEACTTYSISHRSM